jgi:hypothetical protein
MMKKSSGSCIMKTIEIDFDVHRLVELERRDFDEPENAALRRLLKLPEQSAPASADSRDRRVTSSTQKENGRPWSGKGVVLPHGTELRMEYRGQIVRGTIDDATWLVEGIRTTSPSDAAGSAVLTKDGARPSLNGWVYWEVKRPNDGQWRALKSVKPK